MLMNIKIYLDLFNTIFIYFMKFLFILQNFYLYIYYFYFIYNIFNFYRYKYC